MRSYRVSHHAPHQLRRGLVVFNKRTNRDTAMLLAYLSEFDEQKLYRPEAYSSMQQFCVQGLGMSADGAEKRIRVARITRAFPALFPAIADGSLHLTGVLLLAPVLTQANAANLVHAASRKSCEQIRQMLAQWFPKPEPVAQVVLPASPATAADVRAEPAPERVGELSGTLKSLAIPTNSAPRPVSFARFTPVAPGRYAIEGRLDQALVEKLQRAQQLMSHGGKACELALLLELAADLVLAHAERQRFGATHKPRARRSSGEGRHIPEAVKRQVFERDGGQCTFKSDTGRRCESRDNIEFDHVLLVARGGDSSADNIQLLCRAHNQLRAEQTFGPGFMRDKRRASQQHAQDRALEREARAAAKAAEKPRFDAAEELVGGLMNLQLTEKAARAAARRCDPGSGLPLEERFRTVVRTLGPRGATRTLTPTPSAPPAPSGAW